MPSGVSGSGRLAERRKLWVINIRGAQAGVRGVDVTPHLERHLVRARHVNRAGRAVVVYTIGIPICRASEWPRVIDSPTVNREIISTGTANIRNRGAGSIRPV